MPPEESLYYGLILPFEIEFPTDYPDKAPTVRFPPNVVFHPNVYTNGEICLDILQNNWSKVHNVKSIVLSLLLLLKEPNTDSPANQKAAIMFDKD